MAVNDLKTKDSFFWVSCQPWFIDVVQTLSFYLLCATVRSLTRPPFIIRFSKFLLKQAARLIGLSVMSSQQNVDKDPVPTGIRTRDPSVPAIQNHPRQTGSFTAISVIINSDIKSWTSEVGHWNRRAGTPLNSSWKGQKSWDGIMNAKLQAVFIWNDFNSYHMLPAGQNGRTVWDTYCLRQLEHWDRGFESRLKHGCVSAFFCVVLSCVGRCAPSKESYQLSKYIHKFQKSNSE
jgi:hypothetical protein